MAADKNVLVAVFSSHLLLTARFPPAGLSATHFCEGRLPMIRAGQPSWLNNWLLLTAAYPTRGRSLRTFRVEPEWVIVDWWSSFSFHEKTLWLRWWKSHLEQTQTKNIQTVLMKKKWDLFSPENETLAHCWCFKRKRKKTQKRCNNLCLFIF